MFDEMAVKTVKGTEKGSVYVVAFEGGGLRVSVRPFVNHHPILLSLAMRVRVETMSPDGAIELAKEWFGMPFDHENKGGHSSVTMVVPIMSVPFGPKEANEIVFGKGLINLLLDDLTVHIMKHPGMVQVTAKEVLYEFLANQVRDQLPTDTICPVEHKVYHNDLTPVIEQIKAAIQTKMTPKG